MSTSPTPPPAADFVPPAFPGEKAAPAAPNAQSQTPAATPQSPNSANTPKTPPDTFEKTLNDSAEKHFSPKPKADAPPAPAKTEPAKKDAPAADTPPPVAAADADPFAHIKPEDGMSEKSLTGWKALKTEATQKVRDAEKKYAEAQAQLETFKKATPAQTEDAERLKTELKQARDSLAIYDLRHDPDFTRQYVEPKKKALDEAKMLLADNAIDGPDMASLLAKPRAEFAKTVSELAAKLPAFDQGSLVASMREAYRLHGEEAGALTKAGELKQALESKRAMEARKGFDEAKNEVIARIPELPIPEGADADKVAEITAFNKARQEAFAEMENMAFAKKTEREVGGITARAAMTNLMAHHVLPAETRRADKAMALVKELSAELAAIKSAKRSPGFNEGANAAPSRPDYSKLPPEKAFAAMAESHFGRQ